MRGIILAGVSTLALGLSAVSAHAAPVFSWTGCYVGVHSGGGWGDKSWKDTLEFTSHNIGGWLVGGQAGCDYQTGQLVLGVEATAAWANLEGDSLDSLSVAGRTLRDFSKVEGLGTLGGRVGWALDRTLIYASGGAAWAIEEYTVKCASALGATCNSNARIGTTYQSADETRWGWFIGVGVEYSFAPNWSVKAEYNYMDFGTERLTFTGPIAATTDRFAITQDVHVAKLGLNRRF